MAIPLLPSSQPTPEVFVQFGTQMYAAELPIQLRMNPDLEGFGSEGSIRIGDRDMTLSCQCGGEVTMRLHPTPDGSAAVTMFTTLDGQPRCTVVRVPVLERPCQHWVPLPIGIADVMVHQRLYAAEERLKRAREALAATGYFTADQIGDDIAPRIHELASHYGI